MRRIQTLMPRSMIMLNQPDFSQNCVSIHRHNFIIIYFFRCIYMCKPIIDFTFFITFVSNKAPTSTILRMHMGGAAFQHGCEISHGQ